MSEVYPMMPAASKAVWVLVGIVVLTILVAAAIGAAAWAASHTRVVVKPAGLAIEGDAWFGRTLAWSELDTGAAEVVSICGDSPHRPRRRTWGTGLPGYGAGWFRLASGEKALAFFTHGEAVRVPTTHGWSLLVTVEQPESLVERIRAEASRG